MKRFSTGILIGFLFATLFSAPWVYQAWAVGSCAVFRTWNTGDAVTAGDLNSSFTTAAVTNSTPQCLDDYSATVSQMQSTADPFASSAESLATSTAGEIERLRFMFKQIFGLTQWYRHDQAPTFSFSHMNAQALHLGSTGVAGGTDTVQNQFLSRFPVLTGPDHWTGIWWPHNTAHMAFSFRDYNHAQGGVQGGIELFRFHARGVIFHHTVALMFKHSESQMHGGQRGHVTAIQIDPGTDQLIFGHAGAVSRLTGVGIVGSTHALVGVHADGRLYSRAQRIRFAVYLSANQSIANSDPTKVQFNTEEIDASGVYDNASNFRFTVPAGAAGEYIIGAVVGLSNTAADSVFRIMLFKNGLEYRILYNATVSTAFNPNFGATALLTLSPGDFIEIFANQNNGAQNLTGGRAHTYLWGYQLD